MSAQRDPSQTPVDIETSQAEEESPFPLTDIDRYILSLRDDQFTPHTWTALKQIIAENRLELLRRYPSDLKRYIKWSAATKRQYGSMGNFVLQVRLKWTLSAKTTPQTGPLFDYQNPVPFADPADYKILPNDWPYGLDKGITHLIVWLKTRLEVEPSRGDLTPTSRAQVNDFVQQHFVKRLASTQGDTDQVIWFKNWVSLQSVPGIDHVHILLRNVPQSLIDEEWTHGQRPLQDQVNV